MLKQEYRHTDSRIEKPVDSRAYIQTAEDPHAKLVNDVHERVRKHLHENPNQFKGDRGDTGPEWRREDAATLVQEIVRQELPGIVRSELASGDFRGPEGKAGATSEEIFKDVLFLVEENILNPAHNERFRGPKGESIVGPAGAPGKDSIVPGPQGPKGEPGKDSTVPGPEGVPGKDSTVPGPVGPKGEPGKDATVDDIRKAFAEVLADPELNKLAFAKLLQVQEVVGQQEQEIERRRLVALRPAVAAIRQSIENATQGAVVPAEKPAPQQPMTKKRWFSFTR